MLPKRMIQMKNSMYCDYCQDCNRPSPTRQEIERAGAVIEATQRRKINSAMNMSNKLRSKLRASRAASSLYHRACIPQSSDTGAELGRANELFTVGEDSKRIPTQEMLRNSQKLKVSQNFPTQLDSPQCDSKA